MRDAIQGMLSMSQMGGGLTLNANNPSPFETKPKPSYHRNLSTQHPSRPTQHPSRPTQHPSRPTQSTKKRKLPDDDDIVYKDDQYGG